MRRYLYVALFTALPSDAGGGTEVTGGDYTRRGGRPCPYAARSRPKSYSTIARRVLRTVRRGA